MTALGIDASAKVACSIISTYRSISSHQWTALEIDASAKVACSVVSTYRSIGGPLLWPQDGRKKLGNKLTRWLLGLIRESHSPYGAVVAGN